MHSYHGTHFVKLFGERIKMKRKKELSRKPLFSVGDQIKHSKYGKGTIYEIDSRMFPDFNFFYYAKFRDGTKVWLPKFKTEKSCEKLIGV